MDKQNFDLMSYSENEEMSNKNTRSVKKTSKQKRKNKRRAIIIALVSFLLVLATALTSLLIYWNSLLNNVNRVEIDENELAPNKNVFTKNVINIALFGIDARADSYKGLSDAIIVLTIDKKHNKIKMTSIARDSYVLVQLADGTTKRDKLTHVYNYKNGGAPLSIKTLNQNFALDITDYVTINFFGLVEIIDELGGVTVDVSASEMNVMNNKYAPELNSLGLNYKPVTKTGLQNLSGVQALAYSRDRYSGNGDVDRGNRQKEVLTALYKKVLAMDASKYPSLIKMALSNCETTLTNSEITELGSWAVLNSCTIESFSLPDEECNPKHGDEAMINGVWYYIYDFSIATEKLHNFINEEGPYYVSSSSAATTGS